MNGAARVRRASACLLGLWLSASAGAQTTIHVAECGDDSWSGMTDICQGPDGPKATIQAGIDGAADGDTVLVHPGTYSGEGNREVSFGGKAITVRSAEGPEATVVDIDELNARGFRFAGETGASRLEGLTIRNARFDAYGPLGAAGISVAGASPTIVDCVIEGCVRFNDCFIESAGVYVRSDGAPVFEDCVFRANEVDSISCASSDEGRGGAVFVGGAGATFVRCWFEGNISRWGGAIAVHRGVLHLDRCVFDGNTARRAEPFDTLGGDGGALYCYDSTVVAEHCLFSGNTAQGGPENSPGWGGAVATYDPVATVFTACAFTGNVAEPSGWGIGGEGGAVLAAGAEGITLTGCLFASNAAPGLGSVGGAALLSGDGAAVLGCTVTGTDADGAEALYVSNGSIENSIVYTNSAPGVAGGAAIRFSNIQGGFGGQGNIDADPLFVDAPNADYRLGAGSPCIDAGDNAAVPLGFPTDLSTDPRFRDDPATPDTGVGIVRIVDMGAYEYQPGPFCAADFNDDGVVNTVDMLRMLNAWGAGEATADLNADGQINTLDVLEYLGLWGAGC